MRYYRARGQLGVRIQDDSSPSSWNRTGAASCTSDATRAGRTARAYTSRGVLNLRNARFAADDRPLDPGCQCPGCSRHTRAYLHHLFRCDEMLGPMLLTWHNLAYYQSLMRDMRTAIFEGRFGAFSADIRARWQEGDNSG